jgi:hypothetical protein
MKCGIFLSIFPYFLPKFIDIVYEYSFIFLKNSVLLFILFY